MEINNGLGAKPCRKFRSFRETSKIMVIVFYIIPRKLPKNSEATLKLSRKGFVDPEMVESDPLQGLQSDI